MVSRKTAAVLAAAALCTLGSYLRADDSATAGGQQVITTPRLLADAAPPRRPMMAALQAAGVGEMLEKYNINIAGHVEGSYTYNANNPKSGINDGRFFDKYHNEPTMNQFDLRVERTVDATKNQFDIGGRMEWIYGTDAQFIHSNGLFDWYDAPARADEPEYQFDLNQLYLDMAIPIGKGLLIRAGKFNTPIGMETVDPTSNNLFSHGYLFNFVGPYTQTGVMGTYNLSDAWAVNAGITRGWNQSNEDNNGAVDFLGGVKWVADKNTTAIVNVSVGPQQTGNDTDYRTLLELLVSHTFNDKFSMSFEADWVWDQNGTSSGSDAYWYGLGAWASYKLNDYFTMNGRLEWLRDDGGATTGVGANYYEITLGVTIHPMPNDRWGQYLVIRPEIRFDCSDENAFDSGSSQNQLTFGVDAIYSF